MDILPADDEPDREWEGEDIEEGFFHDVVFEGPEIGIRAPAGAAAAGEDIPYRCCDQARPHGPDGEYEDDVGVEAIDSDSKGCGYHGEGMDEGH